MQDIPMLLPHVQMGVMGDIARLYDGTHRMRSNIQNMLEDTGFTSVVSKGEFYIVSPEPDNLWYRLDQGQFVAVVTWQMNGNPPRRKVVIGTP